MAAPQASEVRGKTMRWHWTEGPTKGMTHEHVFHDDGTVQWRQVDEKAKGAPKGDKPKSEAESPEYSALKAGEDVVAVSYQSGKSGYTLTVVLNFKDHNMVGFASGAKDWHPLRGTFEVVN